MTSTLPEDTSDDTIVPPLTERMRQKSRKVHDDSDKLVNLKLSFVLTSKLLYAEAISLFWPIYMELEALLEEHKDHEQLRLFHPLLSILRRAPRFEQDLEFLLESQSAAQNVMQRRLQQSGPSKKYSPPELQSYIDRLHTLSKENPIVLIAYVYSMYSAIVAGGAMIKRMVKMTYGLKSEDGVQIFVLAHNDELESANLLRIKLKEIINQEMHLSENDENLILQETREVFRRNNALVATVKDNEVFMVVLRRRVRDILAMTMIVVVAIVAAIAWKRT